MIIYVDTPLKQKEKALLKHELNNDFQLHFKDEIANDDIRLETLKSADIVFGNPKPEWMAQTTKARWIQLYSAGFEYYQNIKLPALVTNMQDYYSQPCAETMIAGIMALYRRMDTFGVLKSKKEWVGPPIRLELQLLNKKRVIILGTGNIGRRIAKILSGFDAEIVFFGRTAKDAELKTKEDLLRRISWADIVIGCLPGTAETKGLITKQMIEQMKRDALFCNVH
jgi:glyoxylate/hydroxypyruvate reductase